jgi:hypothetical protein
MRRRTLLTLGVAATAVLTLAGGTLALIQPARRDGRLSDPAQEMLKAVALAVLGGLVPTESASRTAALQAHTLRVAATIGGMPPAMQAEVDELLTIVASAPGRRALVGLSATWSEASTVQVVEALQAMRLSSLALRQQAFHALRDITNASYFADPSTWPAIGYPGPRDLTQAPQS